MLDRIIAFSIKNKFVVIVMLTALIIWGVWSITKIQIDAVPDITNNQVQIITLCPALAGQEVEQLVTYPIEQSIANLPDLVELRSISRFGLSVITVVFEDDVDIFFARQLITEKLRDAEGKIPAGAGTPELAPVSTGLGEIFQYIIHPGKGSEDKYSAMDLRTMQDWIVARQLYGTPGIAEVNSFGGELKQYEVSIDPDRLLAMGVTIPDIFNALEKNNENTGGAYIDKKPNAYFIRGIGLVSSFDDINNIVVRLNPNGIPILIKDVAEVRFGSAVRYGAMTYNGEKDAVGGVIMMLKGANSAEVVSAIKEKLPVIERSLPPDVMIEAFLDRSDLVGRAINTVVTNLAEGALIVIFVLVLFLGNIRAGIIVASAIPLSMLFAFGMMNLFGVSANLMSLGAIDFGLVVDGAVIVVEATMHHLGLRKGAGRLTQSEMDEEVFRSASKIRKSAAFGEVIILIVYIPVLTLIGIEGKMFKPMAQTVGFAILGALILSLTYVPMMCALFLSKEITHKETYSDRLIAFFRRIYTPALDFAVRYRKPVVISAVIAFVISVVLFSRMGADFLPTLQEGDFAFHCILPQGTSLSQSIETSMQASRILKQFDEVKMVVGKTGSAEVPTDPMPPEVTDMMVILKPPKEWKRDITYNGLADEMMNELQVIPGAFFEKSQPIQMRFNELMTGIRQDVAVKIFGENLDTLLEYANKVSEVVETVKGVTDPMVERVAGLPQIVIEYKRAQIANYGLNIEDINHVISTAFAGGKAGVVFEDERRFDLVVRADSMHRTDIGDLTHLYIPAPSGVQIPLSQVAEIRYQLGPAQISRESGKRRIVIGFNIKDRDIASVVEEIQAKLGDQVKLPEGYYFAYGGTFENLRAASKRLSIAVPLALSLIFILLYFTFNSVKQAILIFTAIPMSAIGGVLALLLRDMPFSISAGIGFIALFGVAVLNGIVLISTFNQLKKDGMTNSLEIIKQGTALRLRPVLMTASVASLGFLPMALSRGAGAEVQKPLATVVIGGLITATFLTLFVLPLLYMMIENFFGSKRKPAGGFGTIVSVIAVSAGSLFLQTSPALSQQQLTLDQAIDIALRNNLQISSSELEVMSAQSMRKSSFELPKTDISVQYGQFNSINNDLSFSINQVIPFPTHYSAKADVFDAKIELSKLNRDAAENTIKSKVRSAYHTIAFLSEYRARLLGLDSAYAGFVSAASLRYATGESNLLEKTTAEAKHGGLRQKLRQNEAGLSSAYGYMKSLLNTADSIIFTMPVKYEPLVLDNATDTSLLGKNPELRSLYQAALVIENERKMESANLLPDLSVGYSNQSIIGLQNVDGSEVYYDAGKRFQSFNIGIAIPMTFFNSSQKSESLDYLKKSQQREADSERLRMKSQLETALLNYSQQMSEYEYYQTSALPNAETMINTASVSFRSGEIGYVEYVQGLENAEEIRLGYLECINRINQTVTEVNYIINKQ